MIFFYFRIRKITIFLVVSNLIRIFATVKVNMGGSGAHRHSKKDLTPTACSRGFLFVSMGYRQLFDEYEPVELKIWHTFTDTTMEEIAMM